MFTVLVVAVVIALVLSMVAMIAGVVSYIRTPDAITKRQMQLADMAARIDAL